MSKSKPVLRAVSVPSEGLALCSGCYFNTPEGFACRPASSGAGTAAPAKCCNFNGHGEWVIFKEVDREPVCNPA